MLSFSMIWKSAFLIKIDEGYWLPMQFPWLLLMSQSAIWMPTFGEVERPLLLTLLLLIGSSSYLEIHLSKIYTFSAPSLCTMFTTQKHWDEYISSTTWRKKEPWRLLPLVADTLRENWSPLAEVKTKKNKQQVELVLLKGEEPLFYILSPLPSWKNYN